MYNAKIKLRGQHKYENALLKKIQMTNISKLVKHIDNNNGDIYQYFNSK